MKKALLLLAFSVVNSAYGSNLRSAVSLTGNDANPCTTTAPCRSFSTAIGVTVDQGEIIALDSAGYGPFTIGKSIVVSGAPGVHAAISVATGNGIVVSAGTVTIRNLVFIGGSLAGYGNSYQSGAALRVTECYFSDFDIGIYAAPSTGQLFVDHTSIETSNYGVSVANMTNAWIGDSIINNCSTGILVSATSGLPARAFVTNSRIAHCLIAGMTVNGTSSSIAIAQIAHTSIEQNSSAGIHLDSDVSGSVSVYLNGNDIDSIGVTHGGVNYTLHTYSNNSILDNGGLTLTATGLQ